MRLRGTFSFHFSLLDTQYKSANNVSMTFSKEMKGFPMIEDTHLFSTTKAIAESVLSTAFGESARLGEGSDLGGSNRSLVLRIPVQDGPEAAPGSVIVSHTYDAQINGR